MRLNTHVRCNPRCGRYPEQERRSGARKQREVPASAQSGGRWLVPGKNGSDLCMLLHHTINCGVWKRTCCTRQLLCCWRSGARCMQELFPNLTWDFLAVQESLHLSMACLGDLLLILSLENCSDRHCTIFRVLPARRTWQAGSGGLLRVLFCPDPLKDFHVCRSPFFLHFATCLKSVCSFPSKKQKMRFLQETWEHQIAKSSWFWAY